jgi:hypothetical protein
MHLNTANGGAITMKTKGIPRNKSGTERIGKLRKVRIQAATTPIKIHS